MKSGWAIARGKEHLVPEYDFKWLWPRKTAVILKVKKCNVYTPVWKAGVCKMVPARYLKEYLTYPHRIWYTEAPGQVEDQVRTRWPWLNFQGGYSRRRHMKEGFRSISQELFDVSSPNLVHRSTRARQRTSVTLTSLSRSRKSFKATAYERWSSLNIWRNICRILTGYGTHEHQIKTKTKFEPDNLDLIFEVTEVIQGNGIWKMVSAKYLKKYLMYPHQEWITEAP